MAAHKQSFLALPFFLSILGMLFSLWNLWGDSSALCITEGCSLFQDFTIAGISLWWLGLGGCVLLAAIAVPGLSGLGFFVSSLGLVADCLLLAAMLTTAPCFNCLIIGVILALIFLSYRAAYRYEQRLRQPPSISWVLSCWTLLFVLNLGSLANIESGSWALSGMPTEAPVRIYFSPSCSACLHLLKSSGHSTTAAQGSASSGTPRAIWYPVAENYRDVLVIASLEKQLRSGKNLEDSLAAAVAETPVNPSLAWTLRPSALLLQWRLWRNKAHILKSGSSRLPFVEFQGAPEFMLADAPNEGDSPRSAPSVTRSRDDEMSFLDVGGFCDGSSAEDAACLEPAPSAPGAQSLRSILDRSGIPGTSR